MLHDSIIITTLNAIRKQRNGSFRQVADPIALLTIAAARGGSVFRFQIHSRFEGNLVHHHHPHLILRLLPARYQFCEFNRYLFIHIRYKLGCLRRGTELGSCIIRTRSVNSDLQIGTLGPSQK